MADRADIATFLEDLQAAGRYSFTDAEAQAAAGSSAIGAAAALRRLRAARRMVTPRRGFHVIVPPEYRDAGAPPASWFIDDLMRYVGRRYYVGLLSAAAVHGAAHQQPMRFQVVTSAPLRPVTVGRVHIDFHVSRSIESTPTRQVQTDTGYMTVSTAAVTAFDLVRFAGASGGLSNVATVLSELAEKLQVDELRAVAATRPTPQIQRLGCLLDLIDRQGLADPLLRALTGRRVRPVSLTGRPVSLAARPGSTSEPAPAPPWRVVVDESVEVDA